MPFGTEHTSSAPAYTEVMHSTRHRVVEPVPPQLIKATATAPSWGSFDAVVSQYGVRRYRLTVYPPGTRLGDRCLARLWQSWPIGGAALMLLAEMLLGDVLASAATVLVYALGVYLATGALLFVRGGPARVPVRSMSVVLMPNSSDMHELCRYTHWRALVDMLTQADRRLTAGVISSVQHEAIWWDAYDRLEEWSRS